jgi:hypothetical protein
MTLAPGKDPARRAVKGLQSIADPEETAATFAHPHRRPDLSGVLMRLFPALLATLAVALVAVPTALATRFTDDSYFVPRGQVGASYSHWFHGDGGCGPGLPYQFRILSGDLPPGVSLSKDGHLSGTPTRGGTYSFWVELSDQNPPTADWCVPKQAEREFTVVVDGGSSAPALPPLAVTTASTPAAVVGAGYSVAFQASGGGSQSWSLASGTLPPGLSLASNGVVAGTPTAAGTWGFTARVAGDGRSAERAFSIVVRAPLTVSGGGTRSGEVGLALAPITLASAGASGTTTWRLDGALPAGVSFDAASAQIAGTPTGAGSFALKAVATDAAGRSTSVDLGLVIAPRLLIRTSGLVVGRVGRAYRSYVRTAGGIGPMQFRIASGRLPSGLDLDTARGILTGSPRKAGVSRITVEARDTLGVVTTKTFTLSVRKRR